MISLQSLDSLEAYFQRPGIDLTSSKTRTDEYHAILEKLEPNTRSTFSLLALYYRDLALDMATPMAYLGHVSIKMAYHEVPGDMRSLSVKGQSRIPSLIYIPRSIKDP